MGNFQAQDTFSILAYRGDVGMRYKILYSMVLENFEVDVQFWMDAGWKPLGNPSIQIREYTKWVENGHEKFRASQWMFHQAMTKEGDDDDNYDD